MSQESCSGIEGMGGGGGGASTAPAYILQTTFAGLPNSQALGALATGVLKSTTVTGVLSIAPIGTLALDYKYGASQTDNTLALDATRLGIVIDGTAAPTAVPLVIKNAKPLSGIDLQATASAATGVIFRNTAGAQKGAMGVAVAAGDWTLGSLAGDFVITGASTAGAERIFIRTGPAAADASFMIASSGYGNPGQILMTTGNASLNMTNSGGSILGYGACTLTMATAAATFAAAVPVVFLGGGAGSAASAGNLDLQSTIHATKGLTRIGGTTGLVYDETAKRLGIGLAAPAALIDVFANATTVRIKNSSTTNPANLRLENADSSGAFDVFVYGASNASTTFGITQGGRTFAKTNGGDLCMGTSSSNVLLFATTNVERMQVDALGSVVIGTAALATTATDGFLYIPGGAGPPTGVATAKAGRVALYYDTTNNKFYIYNGAWRGGTTPGAFV